MSERCELSDLPVEQCACRIHLPEPDPGESRNHMIQARFPAHFDSYCDGCGAVMSQGDPIARTVDGDYICESCMP